MQTRLDSLPLFLVSSYSRRAVNVIYISQKLCKTTFRRRPTKHRSHVEVYCFMPSISQRFRKALD